MAIRVDRVDFPLRDVAVVKVEVEVVNVRSSFGDAGVGAGVLFRSSCRKLKSVS